MLLRQHPPALLCTYYTRGINKPTNKFIWQPKNKKKKLKKQHPPLLPHPPQEQQVLIIFPFGLLVLLLSFASHASLTRQLKDEWGQRMFRQNLALPQRNVACIRKIKRHSRILWWHLLRCTSRNQSELLLGKTISWIFNT